jgi:hypothetical protein
VAKASSRPVVNDAFSARLTIARSCSFQSCADGLQWRNRRTDRRSRLGFAQVFHLKVDELPAAEMAGAMQGEEHAFDLVGLERVIREPCHALGEQIGMGLNVGDGYRRRWSSGSLFQWGRPWLILAGNITFLALKIH